VSDVALLAAAIAASGLSARRFAVEVLIRDERTVRRWLDASEGPSARPMPEIVRAFLTAYLARHRRRDRARGTPR